MAVTIRDVAEKAGVGVGTVSRTLNGAAHVRPATRERIEAAMRELDFQPNTHASNLKRTTAMTIGFFFSSAHRRHLSDPFFSTLMSGLADEASGQGYDLLVASAPADAGELEKLERFVSGGRVSGIILTDTRVNDARVELLRRQKVPFVAFGRVKPASAAPCIDVDGKLGIERATHHLFAQGHTAIGLIGLPEDLTCAVDRVDGYRAGYALAHRKVDPNYVVAGGISEADGTRAAEQLFSLPNPPTAIIACSDVLALGALRAIHQRGLRAGRDIALIGFDDIPVAGHTSPPLTTIRQPVYDIATDLVRMLIKHIAGEPVARKVIKPELIVRESTTR